MAVRYFAYGSNMLLSRLRSRAPSANFIKIAKLEGYALRFHKRSKDGSGKADAFHTADPTDVVWGAVFDITEGDGRTLDREEGLGYGYSRRTIRVVGPDGQGFPATMYVADEEAIDSRLRPYSSYMHMVLEGARQHDLPSDYVANLSKVETWAEPNRAMDRWSHERSPKVEVPASGLEELRVVSGRWPAYFSCNQRGEVWISGPAQGLSRDDERDHVQGRSEFLDVIVKELLKRRQAGGRFYVNEKGVFRADDGQLMLKFE